MTAIGDACALPWSKARAEMGMGMESRDAAVGGSNGTGTVGREGQLGKSDFLSFTPENEPLKRLGRSWSNSF